MGLLLLNEFNSIEKVVKLGKKPCNVGRHCRCCVYSETANYLSKKQSSKKIRRESKKVLRKLEKIS